MSKMQGTLIQTNDDGSMTVYLCKKYNTFADILLDENPPQYALCVDTGIYYKRNEDGTWPEAVIPVTWKYIESSDNTTLRINKGLLESPVDVILTSDPLAIHGRTLGWASEDWTSESIAAGKTVFGKQGTFTQNATATEDDIVYGKTAGINGVMISGKLRVATGDGSGGSSDMYHCTMYDDGSYIPGYDNIAVTGTQSMVPAASIGEYTIKDKLATGTSRVWRNMDYILLNNGGRWILKSLYESGTDTMTCLQYTDSVFPRSEETGKSDNPIYWSNAQYDESSTHVTRTFTTYDFEDSSYRVNLYVHLLAGINYRFGITGAYGDAKIVLYDLSRSQITAGDDNSIDLNGMECSDHVSYTPSSTGLYILEAGAYGSDGFDFNVYAETVPADAAPSPYEHPWDFPRSTAWHKGGAAPGEYAVYRAGFSAFVGVYDEITEEDTTKWVNRITGAEVRKEGDGDTYRWTWYESSSSPTWRYRENNAGKTTNPWAYTYTWNTNGTSVQPEMRISTGYNIAAVSPISRVSVEGRAATGVRVWDGYRITQNPDTKKWEFSSNLTTGISVEGMPPKEGKVYTKDTMLQVHRLITHNEDSLVCLAKFDDAYLKQDETGTCIVHCQGQSELKSDEVKFGKYSWYGNYRNPPHEGGFEIYDLPEISGDFTIEFWHWHSAYNTHGGLIVCVPYVEDYELRIQAELMAKQLPSNHPLYIEKKWFHHAFVRQNGVVSEYINGTLVNTENWNHTIGGDYPLIIYGGGWETRDTRNYIDEFAIYTTAKYTKNFTPMDIELAALPNVSADNTVGDVSISGFVSVPKFNSRNWNLIRDGEYSYDKVWQLGTQKVYMIFRDMGWVICNSLVDYYYYAPFYVEYAYNTYYDEYGAGQWGMDPIASRYWVESGTKAPLTISYNLRATIYRINNDGSETPVENFENVSLTEGNWNPDNIPELPDAPVESGVYFKVSNGNYQEHYRIEITTTEPIDLSLVANQDSASVEQWRLTNNMVISDGVMYITAPNFNWSYSNYVSYLIVKCDIGSKSYFLPVPVSLFPGRGIMEPSPSSL